jgi:hypothetical protein
MELKVIDKKNEYMWRHEKTQFMISFHYIISLSNFIINFWSWDPQFKQS